MTLILKLIVFVLGLLLVMQTIASAIQTFVLPRGATDFITGAVFRFIRWCFDLLLKPTKNYATRDRFMALYAPVSVLVLLPGWLILVSIGYTGLAGFCWLASQLRFSTYRSQHFDHGTLTDMVFRPRT